MVDAETTLTDAQVQLLTDARNVRWRLESYEFAYDACIRQLNSYKTILEFLAFAVAFILLFVEYVVSQHSQIGHEVISLVEKGLSIGIISLVVWGHMARWVDQTEKKCDLSRRCHELIGEHSVLREEQPLDEKKIRKWIHKCDEFENDRKHESATLKRKYLQGGHQHVGNLHVKEGVLCLICDRQWTQEMNRIDFWSRVFKEKCEACGVPYEKESR